METDSTTRSPMTLEELQRAAKERLAFIDAQLEVLRRLDEEAVTLRAFLNPPHDLDEAPKADEIVTEAVSRYKKQARKVHWTQRPENHDRVVALRQKGAKTLQRRRSSAA